MFNFLQTPEGLKATAFVVTLIILFAFSLGAHPFKKKQRLVAAAPPEHRDQWTASTYFAWLNANIKTAKDLEKLQTLMPKIEAYYDTKFKVPISTKERQRYYSRLLESYCQREYELEHIVYTYGLI